MKKCFIYNHNVNYTNIVFWILKGKIWLNLPNGKKESFGKTEAAFCPILLVFAAAYYYVAT